MVAIVARESGYFCDILDITYQSPAIYFSLFSGSRVGAVVRALASHQCVPGSILGPGVICGLSLLLVLYSAARGFSPRSTPVFPSHQKPTLLNSNSIWKQWMKSHLVEMPLQIPLSLSLLLLLLLLVLLLLLCVEANVLNSIVYVI